MIVTVYTLFPNLIDGYLNEAILARAVRSGQLTVQVRDLRRFAGNPTGRVDDAPYGGGAGMVIRPDVVASALAEVHQDTPPPDESILLTPAGERATQGTMETLASQRHICLVAGRYEGFDARAERRFDRHLSIGDYVLMGGELPALVILEAVARLLPGVLGDEDSHRQDSFSSGLLDYPQYTRPALFEGEPVPEVLTSGHHGKVEAWRRQEALKRTAQLRPDLIDPKKLTPDERAWLDALLTERKMDREA